MFDFLRELHAVSRGGLLLSVISLFIFGIAFRGVNIGQVISVSGRASQSVKWQNRVFKLIVGCIGTGVLLFIVGFSLPTWEKTGSVVAKTAWYGKWSINIQSAADLVPVLSTAESVKFYPYQTKGEKIFEGMIKDGDESEIGSFERLESDMGNNDFRIIKGQCQIKSGKAIWVELAMHGNKEIFSGIIYESKSAKRYTCWGRKL